MGTFLNQVYKFLIVRFIIRDLKMRKKSELKEKLAFKKNYL